jgi:DUF971 family protein
MPNLTKVAPAPGFNLLLGFDTGEEFTLSCIDLRFHCPCATCVDEMTGVRTLKKESLKPDVKPLKVEPVGRYGIHVEWSDGHRTGMYHFDRLYEIAKSPLIREATGKTP